MKKLTESIAWCCVELSLWLYDKKLLTKLADWLFIAGFKLRVNHVSQTNVIITDEEWMYDWQFHYNVYSKTWRAYHREDTKAYWNGGDHIHPMYEASCPTSLLMKLQEDHAA